MAVGSDRQRLLRDRPGSRLVARDGAVRRDDVVAVG